MSSGTGRAAASWSRGRPGCWAATSPRSWWPGGTGCRALVRPGSRTGFLEGLGVEIQRGDLTDPAACDRALDGVALVFHCAAKVGDWGSWQEFQVGCIDATRTLAEASVRAGVERFVHISSTSAYGHPPDQPTPIDETAPLGQNVWFLDHYTRSKVECERLLWDLADSGRLPPDGDPAELALRRARPDDDPPA